MKTTFKHSVQNLLILFGSAGRKQWLVLPPGEEKKLELVPGTFVYDLQSQEAALLEASAVWKAIVG
jgi:hypothetical protein